MRKKIARAYMEIVTGLAVMLITVCLMWTMTTKDLLDILVVASMFSFLVCMGMEALFEAIDEADRARIAELKRERYSRYLDKEESNYGFGDGYEFYDILSDGTEIPVVDIGEKRRA